MRREESNIGDQRILEYKCMELEPKLDILRVFLDNVVKNARIDENKRLFMYVVDFFNLYSIFFISYKHQVITNSNNDEVGLVYFRSGYDPIDYPTEEVSFLAVDLIISVFFFNNILNVDKFKSFGTRD